jgi:poly-gamma-glutamate synthesis protein (capsule biosynthesis protein)
MAVGTAAGLVVGLSVGLLGGIALGGGGMSLAALPLAAGAGGGAGDDDDNAGTADSSAAPVRPAERITLAFAGDIHFENHLAPLADDPDSLAELRASLGAADLAMANLETALTERGAPVPGKPFTWRAHSGALDAVAGAGVDVVSMANNHAVDYGDVGLRDTLAAIAQSPIPVVGIGHDAAEAYAPEIFEVRGVKVAFVSASQVVEETTSYFAAGPGTPGIASALPRTRILQSVREARQEADVVVAYMHMGLEGFTCPGDEAIAAVRDLEAAGADVILGDHAHRVNGAGWVGDAYAHFGLGNFVYYLNTEPAGHTGVLTVTVDVPASDAPRPDRPLVTGADWDAMLISGDGIPRRQDAATTARLQDIFEASRACTPARATP